MLPRLVSRDPVRACCKHGHHRAYMFGQLIASGLRSTQDKAFAMERRGFAIHENNVLASRGSVAYPYRYSGNRDLYYEGPQGTQLNPNHSHYILVDDGTVSSNNTVARLPSSRSNNSTLSHPFSGMQDNTKKNGMAVRQWPPYPCLATRFHSFSAFPCR